MTANPLTAVRDDALEQILSRYQALLTVGKMNDGDYKTIVMLATIHESICRQLDQEDIAEAEAVPLPSKLAIVDQLEAWRLHRPGLADKITAIIRAVLAVEEKGGAS